MDAVKVVWACRDKPQPFEPYWECRLRGVFGRSFRHRRFSGRRTIQTVSEQRLNRHKRPPGFLYRPRFGDSAKKGPWQEILSFKWRGVAQAVSLQFFPSAAILWLFQRHSKAAMNKDILRHNKFVDLHNRRNGQPAQCKEKFCFLKKISAFLTVASKKLMRIFTKGFAGQPCRAKKP